MWRKDPQTTAVPCSRWIQIVYERSLKKVIILILSVASKKFHYSAHGGTLEIPRGMRVFKAKILKWKNCLMKGKLYCQRGEWVLVVGEVGIKTLYGGHIDFMNQHIKYKKKTLKNWMM